MMMARNSPTLVHAFLKASMQKRSDSLVDPTPGSR